MDTWASRGGLGYFPLHSESHFKPHPRLNGPSRLVPAHTSCKIVVGSKRPVILTLI